MTALLCGSFGDVGDVKLLSYLLVTLDFHDKSTYKTFCFAERLLNSGHHTVVQSILLHAQVHHPSFQVHLQHTALQLTPRSLCSQPCGKPWQASPSPSPSVAA